MSEQIADAHRHDPQLAERVTQTLVSLDSGPLAPDERALVHTITARMLAGEVPGDQPAPRAQMLGELVQLVTRAPWTLTRDHLARAYRASLSDEDVLQLACLAACSGYVECLAPGGAVLELAAERRSARAMWSSAPTLVAGRPAIELARRPETAAALAEWRTHVFFRDTPLSRRQRTLLARCVAAWLADGGISPPTDLTVNPHDDALRALAEVVTLAPWQLTSRHVEPLRGAGFDDDAIIDAISTIASAGVFSRIEVALASLAMPA